MNISVSQIEERISKSPSMKNIVNILIADDHPMVRSGIRFMLENQKKFIAKTSEVSNGVEALDSIYKNKFDILLMDIHMPMLNGIDTVEKLRSTDNDLPVLMISVSDDENIVRQAMEKGCNGFILKDAGIEELIRSIETILGGVKYFSNEVTQLLLGSNRKKSSRLTLHVDLTRREFQILRLIAQELNHDQIAVKLNISRRTVEGHKKNLTFKLNVKGSVGLMKYAIDKGVI